VFVLAIGGDLMVNKNNDSPNGNSEDKSNPTKAALWTQIVITVGGVAVAVIAAYQAIKVAQLQSPSNIPTVVFTPILLHTMTNTALPPPVNTQTPTPFHTGTPTPVVPIQRIDFDYQDSPTQHGWKMLENEASEEEVNIEHTFDQFVGNAISITSPTRYGIEYTVGLPAAERGKVLELVANLTKDAYIYTYIGLVSDDGSTTDGWLKLTIREGPPKPIDDDEWQLTMEQVSSKGGNWLFYRIDLQDAVKQTFGSDSWEFQRLEKFRIRGDLSLVYIEIYETQP